MRITRKKLLFPLFLSLGCSLIAQDLKETKINIFFGQMFSSLYYRNSNGETDEYLNNNIRSTYGVQYQKFVTGFFYLRPELSYKNMGAQSEVNNVKLDWDFHYLDLSLGAGIGRTTRFVHKDYLIKPYIGGAFYIASTYKAQQTIGNQSINLQKSNDFNTFDFGLNLNGGIFFDFSQSIGIMLEYRYNQGLRNLENNSGSGKQRMYNYAHSLVFGMCIKLQSL